ncbi:N-substituted formamide deformylase [Durusdinium trenchii]|uniref:N-substituted formamide deformylase n=1 Tax=Durusdinium trenchii TaxID=1381693 RepID=A0ABP0KDE0_9DINO
MTILLTRNPEMPLTSRLILTATVTTLLLCSLLSGKTVSAQQADLILHGGKVVTVDAEFSIAEAIAVRGDRIVAVGADADVLALAGEKTTKVDLDGRTVLPGLIDSHVHATGASMYEFDHPVPDMETIADVLAYVQARAAVLDEGEWIKISQVFVTRLRDQRFPTRYELDQVAPKHPVLFRTGPDAAVNSLALELSGIDKDFEITDGKPGYIERDPETGEPNGILRSCTRLVKTTGSSRRATQEDRLDRLEALFADYNRVGLTSVCDRGGSDGSIALYQRLKEEDRLTCRVFVSYSVGAQSDLEQIEKRIQKAASSPHHAYDNMLWLRGIKIFLDGGMLTGSAYMRQPWGVSQIYSISDPEYRGLIYVPEEKLYRIAKFALENDLQITAHSVGDGAVHALIKAYERIHKDDFSVKGMRPCITHCNFMSAEAIERMQRLDIVADLQPAWLWLDGKTLLRQFGDERLTYFQPYRSLFEAGVTIGGGSDHMQKIGGRRAVNPYNPFLGMWITLARSPRWMEGALHLEQSLSREQAIRLYTINNAYLTFEEKEKGSLEVGKLADLIVLDQDILTVPVDEVKDITVRQTYLGGRLVHSTAE